MLLDGPGKCRCYLISLYWWKFHQYSILKTPAYCCRIKRRTFWGAPQELKNGSCVGSNFRPGRKWTPRELRIFNLVGSNFQTGRKWAPREFKSFNLVGQSFWIDLFLKVSGDSHIGVKWNWPYALTPCPLAQWIFGFKMLCEAVRQFQNA